MWSVGAGHISRHCRQLQRPRFELCQLRSLGGRQSCRLCDRARRLLRRGRHRAAASHPSEQEDRPALLVPTLGLHMEVLIGAASAPRDELRRKIDGAGFRVERVVPTSPTSTIVARAV
jgi:hypothetical protein